MGLIAISRLKRRVSDRRSQIEELFCAADTQSVYISVGRQSEGALEGADKMGMTQASAMRQRFQPDFFREVRMDEVESKAQLP